MELWGLSFSWMTGCGFGTLKLGMLGRGGGRGVKVQYDDYGIEWLLDVSSPVFVPRQLRFSLYSGAVITEGWM